MGPKCLRHIGTSAGDLNDRAEHFTHACARAAVPRRHSQTEKSCAAQSLDGAVLQHPVTLGGGVVAAQFLHDGSKPGQPLGGRTAARIIGEGGSRRYHIKGHCRLQFSESAE